MANTYNGNSPAETYTLTDFIAMQSQDELTYKNFAIFDYKFGETLIDQSVIDYYIKELKTICVKIDTFTAEEIAKYKYAPDLLAYDVYKSTSLDFIVLLCNGIIDPKEFDFKRKYLMLPKSSSLAALLSSIYNNEYDWLSINKRKISEEKS